MKWKSFQKVLADLLGYDIDDLGKWFPKWKMQASDFCLDPACKECRKTLTRILGAIRAPPSFWLPAPLKPTACADAWFASKVKHYAKHRVSRRFLE